MRSKLLKDEWKSVRIRIRGEFYLVHRTFDLGEDGEHIYGYDVFDEAGQLISRYEGCDLAEVVRCMHEGYFPAAQLYYIAR